MASKNAISACRRKTFCQKYSARKIATDTCEQSVDYCGAFGTGGFAEWGVWIGLRQSLLLFNSGRFYDESRVERWGNGPERFSHTH